MARIAASPTLAAANATLAQAREEVTVARAAFLPSVSASAGAQQRHRAGTVSSGRQQARSSNLYSIGLSASYSPDIFGGTRRAVEQQQALAEYQRNQLAAAYLTLTGNVVNEVLSDCVDPAPNRDDRGADCERSQESCADATRI